MGRVAGVVVRSFRSWIETLEDVERVAPLAITIAVGMGALTGIAAAGVL